MYYLQSRYYNPEWGRFINADGIVGTPGELLSTNMFTYCLNNPINMSDEDGDRPDFSDGSGHETQDDLEASLACMSSVNSKASEQLILSAKVNNERPLNDDFLKNKDGSYKKGQELDDLYKNERNAANRSKIKKQQKIFGQRDIRKRQEQIQFSPAEKTAILGAGAVTTTYFIYRAVRFLPSLAPPLWWTIPANAACL